MNRVRMAEDDQRRGFLSGCIESSNTQMTTVTFTRNPIDGVDRADAPRRSREQGNNLVTANFVAGRRFRFNQGTSQRESLSLTPREMLAQRIHLVAIYFNCCLCHLICSDRTVKRSVRARLISNPMPGLSGLTIVPCEVTNTAGSMISSFQ